MSVSGTVISDMCIARGAVLKGMSQFLLFAMLLVAVTPSNTSAQSGIPVFTKQPTDQILSRDTTVTLECEASVDSGELTYSWSFNGVPFESGAGRTYSQDGTLTFSLTDANEGEFACLVSTPQGVLTSRQAAIQIAEITFNLPNQEVVAVIEGSHFTLSCNNYTSVGETDVRWEVFDTIRGSYVSIPPDSDTVIVGDRDFILYFPAVQMDQQGMYRCQVQNSVAIDFRQVTFEVNVTAGSPPSPPPLLSRPQDMTVVVGQRAIFQCIPSGSTVPGVVWFDNIPGDDRFMAVNSYTIFVTDVSTSDFGEYGCRVNGINYTAFLTILDVPQVTPQGDYNYTMPYSDTLSLQCSVADSGEDLTWSWFSNGAKLMTDARGNVSDGSLSLGNTTLMDAGFYQCFATNAAGSSFAVAAVQVITIPPQFTVEGRLRSQVAFRGERLTLTCSAYSAPSASYTWMKDGSAVGESSPGFMVETIDNVGQLVILNITSEFVGNYTCTARATLPENGTVIGEVSSSGEVRMVGPTTFTNMAVANVYRQVKNNPQPIVLDCAIDGDEAAIFNMTWLKNGVPVSSNNSTVLAVSPKQLTLTLQTWSVSDTGEYKCHVSTSLMGFDTPASTNISYVTNVTIATAPAPPFNVIGLLSNVTATQIDLSWEYLGDSPFIVSYTVFRQEVGTSTWIFVTTINDVMVTSHRDNGLFPFSEYRFRVDVTDRQSQSATAYSSVYKTLEAAPTATPIQVSSLLVNDSMLRIRWQPPPLRNSDGSGRNGIITGYEIRHRVPSSGQQFSITTVNENMLQVLLPGTVLEVQIAASTSKGQGPFTDATVFPVIIPTTATPVYGELWFIVVLSVAGLIVLAIGVIIFCICCVFCRKLRSKRRRNVAFQGGNQPNFDVYQYEMEKSTRLRSIQPAVVYHDGHVEIEPSMLGAYNGYAGATDEPYVQDYGPPPPTFYATVNGRVGSLEWEVPPPTFGPQRAKSLEWDPRQYQPETYSTEWSEPESTRGLVDNRLNTDPPSEWTEYPDEVFSGNQVEVVHVSAQGSDSMDSLVEKLPPSAGEDGADDDTGSQANSFAASSTFV